jgi:hypothetical protein
MDLSYHPRQIDALLTRRVEHHPAILIVGPRATGKTTSAARLAKSIIRLDQPAQAGIVRADPDAALRDLPEPILIDEWQIAPEILGAIKRTVDISPTPGRFIVTGSVRGDIESPTWPGTGRLLRMSMYGLSVAEVRGKLPTKSIVDRLAEGDLTPLATTPTESPDLLGYAELATAGGFPEPALRLPPEERFAWYESYIDQLITRDIALLGKLRDPQMTRRFFEACALNTAGVVTMSTLREASGTAKGTAEAYDQLFHNLLVAESLPAWWSNRLKRLGKAPKRYLIDPALALAVLGIDTRGLMTDVGMLGRIIDTFVMAQLRSLISASISAPKVFHLRQQEGVHEVDILLEYGGGRVFAFEVKASSAPSKSDARHLLWLRDELGERFIGGAVLHTGPRSFPLAERIYATPISSLWAS